MLPPFLGEACLACLIALGLTLERWQVAALHNVGCPPPDFLGAHRWVVAIYVIEGDPVSATRPWPCT